MALSTPPPPPLPSASTMSPLLRQQRLNQQRWPLPGRLRRIGDPPQRRGAFPNKMGVLRIRQLSTDSQAVSGQLKLPGVPCQERRRGRNVRAVLSDSNPGGQSQRDVEAIGGRSE